MTTIPLAEAEVEKILQDAKLPPDSVFPLNGAGTQFNLSSTSELVSLAVAMYHNVGLRQTSGILSLRIVENNSENLRMELPHLSIVKE